jgi:hypothetical protein
VTINYKVHVCILDESSPGDATLRAKSASQSVLNSSLLPFDDRVPPPPLQVVVASKGLNVEEGGFLARVCPLGLPTLRPGREKGEDDQLEYLSLDYLVS